MYDDNIRKTSTAVMYDATTTNCSHESLVFSIERFFKSVNTMNSIVMVPSKLVDLEDDASDSEGSVDMSSTASVCSDGSDDTTSGQQGNLYNAYKMLVDAKEDLVWSREDAPIPVPELPQAKQFKFHLDSLTSLLSEFSDLADHLTKKYQNAPGIKEEEESNI